MEKMFLVHPASNPHSVLVAIDSLLTFKALESFSLIGKREIRPQDQEDLSLFIHGMGIVMTRQES